MNKSSSWTNIAIKCCLILLAFLYQFSISESEFINLFNTNEYINIYIVLVVSSVIYAFLLAIPYFPGIEVGIAIMIIFGTFGVISVYIATTLGLLAAFLLGKKLRKNNRPNDHFRKIIISETTEKLSTYSPMFTLMILLNLPGNIVLGGGGGIAMSYGYYRKLSTLKFLISLMIATSPIPILLAVFGVKLPL
tara:strand:+ start:14080 stop:14655 length:576 start_codon:yes stop_codon:yes gene_type:complete